MHTPVSETKCYRINGLSYLPIEGFPDYIINHTGKIFHLSRGEVASHTNQTGYLVVYLHRDGGVHPRLIHRLILKHFDPTWDPETLSVHLDGDKDNNHIRNLSRRSIPFNRAKNERSSTRIGFKVDPTGEIYGTMVEAAAKTGVSMYDISSKAGRYRSFVLGNLRFTALFA